MTRTWVGARGAMSRMASTISSSAILVDGVSPATILQKRQVGSRRGWPASAVTGSPQHRLGAHQEADGTDEPGHDIRDVALPPRQRRPAGIAPVPQPDEAAETRNLDEVADAQRDRVEREGDEQPRLPKLVEPDRRDEPDAGQCEPDADPDRAPRLQRKQEANEPIGALGMERAPLRAKCERQEQGRHEQAHSKRDVRDQQDRKEQWGHRRIVGGSLDQPGRTASRATQSDSCQRWVMSKPAASRA